MMGRHLSMEVVLLAAAAGALPMCIVQSDNRDNTMTRTSFASAQKTNFTHIAYSCYAKGPKKPRVILRACKECSYAVWLDSDVIVRPSFSERAVAGLVNAFPGALIAGVDVYSTIKGVRSNPKHLYHNYFNNGAFVVDCNRSRDILEEWAHYV